MNEKFSVKISEKNNKRSVNQHISMREHKKTNFILLGMTKGIEEAPDFPHIFATDIAICRLAVFVNEALIYTHYIAATWNAATDITCVPFVFRQTGFVMNFCITADRKTLSTG